MQRRDRRRRTNEKDEGVRRPTKKAVTAAKGKKEMALEMLFVEKERDRNCVDSSHHS